MNLQRIIYIALLALIQLSCQELPRIVDGGRVVASVGDKSLTTSELVSAIPTDLKGEDSVVFVSAYVDKWIHRQIKVLEAERIFTSSELEIESMVDAYRQILLTRKLDQYYIDSSKEAPFTDEDVEEYYSANSKNFKLDVAIIKGCILRIPLSNSSTTKLRTLMRSSSEDKRQDLISISEKFEDLELEQFDLKWVNYSDFIEMLPIAKGSNSDQYMKRSGVQSLKDDTHTYLFEITEYRVEGDTAPLERVEGSIRRLLTNEYQTALIHRKEGALYEAAQQNDLIRNYINTGQGDFGKKGYISTLVDNINSQK
ncbi:MAG: hypothetical protein SNH55_07125 [Rikenellaceae bacterium]